MFRLRPVRSEKTQSEFASATILSVQGGVVRVREGGGIAYDAIPPSGLDMNQFRVGDSVLVKRGPMGEAAIVTAYGTIMKDQGITSTGWSPPASIPGGGGTVNGLPLSLPLLIKGQGGISVTEDPTSNTVFLKMKNILDLEGGVLQNVTGITFSGNAASLMADDKGVILDEGYIQSKKWGKEGGWRLTAEGEFIFSRRNRFGGGLHLTEHKLFWYSQTGMPLIAITDESVQMGLPDTNAYLKIDLYDGLKIHGSVVEADTLEGSAIGPKLSAYLSSILGESPLVVLPIGDGTSPWPDHAPADRDIALVMANGLELWARGGTNGLQEDTCLFRAGVSGVTVGPEGNAVRVGVDGTLYVPADAFVGGTLQAGERILIGQGEWGTDFQGIAIDGDGAIVAVLATDTYQQDPQNGTYQVKLDANVGQIVFGNGAVALGATGLRFVEAGDEPRHYITGYSDLQRLWKVGADAGHYLHVEAYDPLNMDDDVNTALYMHGSYGMQMWGADPESSFISTFPYHALGSSQKIHIEIDESGARLNTPTYIAGATHQILFDADGRMGFNTFAPEALVEISGTSNQLRVTHTPSDRYGDFKATSAGATIAAGGDIILSPSTNYVLPAGPYKTILGNPTRKFLGLYVAELNVDTLVAQSVMATIGGRILVGPTTALEFDLPAADTVMFVKHNEGASGDTAYLEANGQVEFIRYNSAPTTVTNDGKTYYRYNVVRNLDGSGANNWKAGDAVFNTGTTGDGWIDLYALNGMVAPTHYGPTITGNLRTGTNYNQWEERWSIGKLSNAWNPPGNAYGVAMGVPSGTYLLVTDTNGIEIRNGYDRVGWWKTTGDIVLGVNSNLQLNINGTATFTGNIVIQGGSGIQNLSDAGSLASMDTLAWSLVTGAGKPEDNATATSPANQVYNGDAEFGDNRGWSGFSYQATGGYGNGPCFSAYSATPVTKFMDSVKAIPVSGYLAYEYRGAFKTGLAGTTIYVGMDMLDVNGTHIDQHHCFRYAGADTTLYATYNSGSTTIDIVPSTADWVAGANKCIQFNTNADNSDLPNRFVTGVITNIDKSNPSYWRVTVASGYASSYTVGTRVSLSLYGNTYDYSLGAAIQPGASWTTAVHRYEGFNAATSIPASGQFRIGTAKVRPVFLGSMNQADTLYIDAFYFAPIQESVDDAAKTATDYIASSGQLVKAPTPSGNGLYLGSTYLGYYASGAWNTYMDNSGRFFLKGADASNYLSWTPSSNTLVFAGWTATPTALRAGSGSTTVGLDASGSNPAFYAGSATPGSAPFRVTNAGALIATNATITGAITATTISATAGSIGGWTLGSNYFKFGSGANTVGLDSSGTNPAIYAGSATPGSAPFQVTSAGAVTAQSGLIGGWTLGQTLLSSGTLKLDAGNKRIEFATDEYLWYSPGAPFGPSLVYTGGLIADFFGTANGEVEIVPGGITLYSGSLSVSGQTYLYDDLTLYKPGGLVAFSVGKTNGDTILAGTLNVKGGSITNSTGSLTLGTNTFITGGLTVNTNKMTVDGNSGAVVIGGSLTVGGVLDLKGGDISNSTGSISFTDNVRVYGTFASSGNATFDMDAHVQGELAVDLVSTFNSSILQPANDPVQLSGGALQVRYGTTVIELNINTNVNADLYLAGKFGINKTPISPPAAYTFTNGTSDRTINCDAASVAELADVVFTMWSDLKAYGLLQ